MICALAYKLAPKGKPAFLAALPAGVLVKAESPAPLYTNEGVIVAKASFTNPWQAPVALRNLRLWHVTMGEMPAVARPDCLDPQGFTLQPGQTVAGRLAFACKKLTVSIPCALEATPSLGQVGRGGVLCVPIEDLEKEAAKQKQAAEKAAKDAAKSGKPVEQKPAG